MPGTVAEPPAVKPGGNYTAVDNGDGTYSLLDLPIFAEVPAGAKKNAAHIGREWMATALQKARLREQEGHLPPVHIYHSDETAVKPAYAGKLRLKRLGQITYEGVPIHALFADVTDIPAEVFAQLKAGCLPYRSVEVHSWEEPEIDSLALMPTDVPFFRMAMTTIGRVVRKGATMVPSPRGAARTPATHFRALTRSGNLVLFKFAGGASMATTPTPAKIPDKGAITTPKDGDPSQSSGATTERTKAETNNPVDFAIEGTAPGGTEEVQVRMADADVGLDQKILSILQRIAEKLGCGEEAEPEAEAPPPDDTNINTAPVPGLRAPKPAAVLTAPRTAAFSARAVETAVLKSMAPLLAKTKTLEARLAARERAEAVEAKLNAAVASLEGFQVDEETAAYFRRCAETGDDMLSMAVEQFKRIAAPEPPSSEEEFERMLAEGPGGEAVNTFAARHPGPQAAEWIRMQAVQHDAYVKASGSDITLDAWLETNWKYEAEHAA